MLTEYNRPVEFEWQLAAYHSISNQNIIVTEWFQQQKTNLQQDSCATEQLY